MKKSVKVFASCTMLSAAFLASCGTTKEVQKAAEPSEPPLEQVEPDAFDEGAEDAALEEVAEEQLRAEQLAEAERLIKKEKYDDAITLLNGLLKEKLDDADATRLLGRAQILKDRQRLLQSVRALIDNGHYSAAIDTLNGMLENDPDDADAKALLAEARDLQARAIAEAAEKARADQLELARQNISRGNYDRAIAILMELLQKNPNDADANSLLGEANSRAHDARLAQARGMIDEGRFDDAIALLNRMMNEDSSDGAAGALLEEARQGKALAEAAQARAEKLAQARGDIDGRRFDAAIALMDGLLADDPADADAAALRDEAAEKKALAEAAQIRAEKLAQARGDIDGRRFDDAIALMDGLLAGDPADADAAALRDEAAEKKALAEAAQARAETLAQARKDIAGRRYDDALSLLGGLLAANPDDKEAGRMFNDATQKKAAADAARIRAEKLAQARADIDGGLYDDALSLLDELLAANAKDKEAGKMRREAAQKKAVADAARARAEKLAQARGDIDGGRFDDAIALLDGMLAADASDAEARALLDEAAQKKAVAEAARARAEKLAQARSDIDGERYDAALALLDGMLADDPQDAEAKALLDEAERKLAAAAARERLEMLAQARENIDREFFNTARSLLNALLDVNGADEDALALLSELEQKEAAQKAAVLASLQQFATEWQSPAMKDIEDCGYFYTSPEYGQFDMIEGEFRKKSGYEKAAYGFVFGYAKPGADGMLTDYIRFEITTEGTYALYSWDGEHYTDLVQANDENTAYFYDCKAINKGYNKSNKLRVALTDGGYSVYVNGKLVKSGVGRLADGTFGVMSFFSVGRPEQENIKKRPVVVSYRITDASLHGPDPVIHTNAVARTVFMKTSAVREDGSYDGIFDDTGVVY